MNRTVNKNSLVSIVLATHNRRDVAVETLARVHRCGMDRGDYEVVVVDNASSDGTVEAIRRHVDRIVPLTRNRGSCAKSWGVHVALGRFIVFLDDDSSPRAGSLSRMIEHFDAEPNLGAVGFRVHLPDGTEECGALPDVFVGCGVGFRADALRSVGGLDRTFFMQAEEYDLAFRLAGAEWGVRMFDDIHVDHLKTPRARRHARTTYFDTRNNLRVIARYLPSAAAVEYRADALQRYSWLAERDGHVSAFRRGARAAAWRAPIERVRYRRRRMSADVFEQFFRWADVEGRMRALAQTGVRRVVFIDLGKNVYAFHRAAKGAGIEVCAIGDDRFAAPGRTYRGTPVTTLAQALGLPHNAVVISNMAPVFADRAAESVTQATDAPVCNWFGRSSLGSVAGLRSTTPCQTSDDTHTEYITATS